MKLSKSLTKDTYSYTYSAIVILILFLSVGFYFNMKYQKEISLLFSKSQLVTPTPTAIVSDNPIEIEPSYLYISGYRNGSSPTRNLFHTVLLDGWKKESKFDLLKKIGNTFYEAHFQLNDKDYLSSGGLVNPSIIKLTKTTSGSRVYVVGSAKSEGVFTFVVASSCYPKNNSGCSLPFGGKQLWIELRSWKGNDQIHGAPLDLNDPDTNKAVLDFIKILESSDL